jgi:CelD/BcsL family acetyltransferase involved in cellulose biosynthesis
MAHLEFDPFRYMGQADPAGSKAAERQLRTRANAARAVTVGDLTVEVVPLDSARALTEAWASLARQTIEPNIFFGPDVMLAAEQHLPEVAGSTLALVWGPRVGNGSRLLALWPMRSARRTPFATFNRGLTQRYASSGAPLLDQRFAIEAASALISGLGELDPHNAGALFQEIALDGAAARTLRAAATLNGLATTELDVHSRACLWPEDGLAAARSSGNKTRREMARQLRGLSRFGDVRLVRAESPQDVRVATEAFLALEASGWKAQRGTSILSQTRDASFYRSMTRALSRSGQIAVNLLEVGERIAAAGLVLKSGGHNWYIKTTYDEALAAYAPGVLLSHEIGLTCLDDTGARFIDSCAVPGHHMIERVWNGRVRIGDLVIAHGAATDQAIAREKARRRSRAVVKRFYYQLRGWPM